MIDGVQANAANQALDNSPRFGVPGSGLSVERPAHERLQTGGRLRMRSFAKRDSLMPRRRDGDRRPRPGRNRMAEAGRRPHRRCIDRRQYTLTSGRIYLSGRQARSACRSCNTSATRPRDPKTGGFISGYRGSPLGMYDHALWREVASCRAQHAFRTGPQRGPRRHRRLGQPAGRHLAGRNVDGAFGIWYGKGRASTGPSTC